MEIRLLAISVLSSHHVCFKTNHINKILFALLNYFSSKNVMHTYIRHCFVVLSSGIYNIRTYNINACIYIHIYIYNIYIYIFFEAVIAIICDYFPKLLKTHF